MVLLKALSGIVVILALDAFLRTESVASSVWGPLDDTIPQGNCTFKLSWFITLNGVCVGSSACNSSQGFNFGNSNNMCPNGTICCMGYNPEFNTTTPTPPPILSNLTSTTTTTAATTTTSTTPSTTTTTTTTTTTPSTTTTSTEAPAPSRRKPRYALAEEFDFFISSDGDAPSPPNGAGAGSMQEDWHVCNTVTKEMQSLFRNPKYPRLDSSPNVCQHIVFPRNDTCAVRYEVLEGYLEDRLGDACSIDAIQILNSGDTPTAPQCGKLDGYQYTVRTKPGSYMRAVITTQSDNHLWNIRVVQVPCSKIQSWTDEQSGPVCGKKGPGRPNSGVVKPDEQVETVSPAEFFRNKGKEKSVISEINRSRVGDRLLLQEVLQKTAGIKIFKGNETGVNEYPWQALILVAGRPLCGGTLISDQWILTAGHCAALSLRLPLQILLQIDLGDHDLQSLDESPNRVYRVSRIVPHIQHQVILHDIALLKLSRKVEFSKAISPVCLANGKEVTYAGETAISTGWGKTESGSISPVLRQAELNVMSNDECANAWEKLGEGGGEMIQPQMLCAGGGEAGPCNGDSGGPLVIEDKNEKGKWRLIGTTSFGALKGCAVPGIPAVYTRISSYLDWIAMNTAQL